MEILIEKINTLGLVKSERRIALPKAKMLITIGDKQFIVNNLGDKQIVERVDPKTYKESYVFSQVE